MKINEIENLITVYHGDNFNTTYINNNYKIMHMKESNVQEGIGVYFADDISVAEQYGKHIISTKIDIKNFLPSRGIIEDYINLNKIFYFLKEINKHSENFWYLISNYVEISGPEDIKDYHIRQVARAMSEGEIRNFQVEALQACESNQLFVESWLKYIKKYGTYNKELGFYAIMHTDTPIKVIT